MKKITKRIFSAILSAIMLILALPLTGFASSKTYVDYGDIIEFGSYPQTQVKDAELIKKLDNIGKSWRSYGYYSGDGEYGSMVQGDWMKYADFKYDGNKYRAVTFSQYRPKSTISESSEKNSYQDDNGYYKNNIYYFLYEPIKWRVVCNGTEGSVAYISELILDSQAFQNMSYVVEDKIETEYYYYCTRYFFSRSYDSPESADKTKYANIYEESSIAKWLNNDFRITAFSTEQKKVESIELMYNKNTGVSDDTGSPFVAFRRGNNGKQFRAVGTDYAKAQGLMVSKGNYDFGYSHWLLRDNADNNGFGDHMVEEYGGYNKVIFPDGSGDDTNRSLIDEAVRTDVTYGGIRPIIFRNDLEILPKGVVSVDITSPVHYGDATVNLDVVVKDHPKKIRFVKLTNSNAVTNETCTYDKNSSYVRSITVNSDNTETWNIDFKIHSLSAKYSVNAKYDKSIYDSGGCIPGIVFELTIPEMKIDKDVYSFSIDECYDDVMYAGVHKVTVETGVDATKVQFYKDGNTWTYSADNASYVIEDDKKIWSINMNFSELGEDMEYYIRTRSQKSAFELTDQVMNVWVRFK